MPLPDGKLTDLEKGLSKHNLNLKISLTHLKQKIEPRTKFTINLLKDDHKNLKEFYIIGDFWKKCWAWTELKEYTNKRGKKSMKHYVGNHFWNPQPEGDKPVLVFGKNILITKDTIDLYDIDDNGDLIANKERMDRWWKCNNE